MGGNHAGAAVENNIGIDNKAAARNASTRSMSIKAWHQRPQTEEMK
jgi:hypothetical protein